MLWKAHSPHAQSPPIGLSPPAALYLSPILVQVMIDKKRLTVIAGEGGNGAVSFLREKFRPRGGPDGGDGGEGGAVVCRAAANVRTLAHLEGVRRIVGEAGAPGRGKERTGGRGKATVVEVPVGTVVWELSGMERTCLTELTVDGMTAPVVYGGEGGWGNVRFASSTNQEPLIALGGEPGEEREIELEVKLLADVALVGAPNAGKSTLLSVVSRAHPKIADYPFTTLEPGFGVAHVGERALVLLDVPGLIEGAHAGRGLGLEFLRHCERALVFVHLVDGLADDLLTEYLTVREEVTAYGAGLADKPAVVAVTKMDVPEARDRYEGQKNELASAAGSSPAAIAAVTGEGVRELMRRVSALVPEDPAEEAEAPAVPRMKRPRAVSVSREEGGFAVQCALAERMLDVVDLRNWRARLQFHGELNRLGVIAALERAGVGPGDTVRIGEFEMEWE